MARVTGALVAAALLGTLLVGGARSESCAQMLEWQGRTYEGLGDPGGYGVSIGSSIGVGLAPPCGEAAGGCSPAEEDRLTVLRIEGVHPLVAVGVAEDSSVYAAVGYALADPRHPLHGGSASPSALREPGCGPATERTGRVGAPPRETLVLELDDDGTSEVVLDPATAYEGLDRYGVAFLPEGTRVAVRIRACPDAVGGTADVAERVAAAE